MNNIRKTGLAVLLGLCLCATAATAQMAGDEFAISSGGVVGGGGASSSAGFSVVGVVSSGPAGSSGSDGFRIESGVVASTVQSLVAFYAGQYVDTVSVAATMLKVTVPGMGDDIAGQIHYRQGGGRSYQSAAMTIGTGDTLVYALDVSLLSARGLQYYFTITQGSALTMLRSSGDPYTFVVSMTNAQGQRPTAMPDASYRIVGVPIEIAGSSTVASVFGDDLGAADIKMWRLGRYSAALDSVVEYPDAEAVEPGRGYWLNARGGKRYGAAGLSMQPDTSVSGVSYYRVPLDSGWNQMANPFAFDVEWSDVRFLLDGTVYDHSADFLEDFAYGYDGSGYSTVTEIPAWGGIFVFVDTSGVTALVKYSETIEFIPTKSSVLASSNSNLQWQIELTLRVDGHVDGGNFAGVYTGSSVGADRYDFSEPPRAPETPMLAFRMPQADSRLRRSDFRPNIDQGAVWNVVLSRESGRQLEISGLDELPGDLQAVLVFDIGTVVSLDEDCTIDVPDDVSSAQLLVGSEAYLEGEVSPLLPDDFELSQNFPNPFNPSTNIRFGLPVAGHVRLDIFNLLGQKVTTLVDADYDAGRHTVVWNGESSSGELVASGVYFYRLSAERFTETRKMLLLK